MIILLLYIRTGTFIYLYLVFIFIVAIMVRVWMDDDSSDENASVQCASDFLQFCYHLTGVENTRSEVRSQEMLLEEARASYRKQLLREHPDKGGSCAAYRAVTAAYEIVCDDIKRSAVLPSDQQKQSVMEHPILSCASMMTLYLLSDVNKTAPEIEVRVSVTLHDVYCNIVKKVVVSVNRWCVFTSLEKERDDLDGVDYIERKMVQKQVSLLIPVNADTVKEAEYVFEGMGNDSLFDGMKRGDIRVFIDMQSHSHYSIDTVVSHYDLHANVQVSIRDYYYGRVITLPGIGGKPPMTVHYEPHAPSVDKVQSDCIVNHRTVRIFKGYGLPRPGATDDNRRIDDDEEAIESGDLFVFFDLVLPSIHRGVLDKPHVRMFFEMIFGMSGMINAFSTSA